MDSTTLLQTQKQDEEIIRREGEKYDPEILRRNTIKAKEIALSNKPNKDINLTYLITEFPLALATISKIHDYQRGPLVKADYLPSLLRHLFRIGTHPDHDAAVAWNALARLEIQERQKKINSTESPQ